MNSTISIETPVREAGRKTDADGREWAVFVHDGTMRVTVEIAVKR